MSDLSKCAQFDCLLVRETEKEMDIGEEERIVKPGSDLRNQLWFIVSIKMYIKFVLMVLNGQHCTRAIASTPKKSIYIHIYTYVHGIWKVTFLSCRYRNGKIVFMIQFGLHYKSKRIVCMCTRTFIYIYRYLFVAIVVNPPQIATTKATKP